MARQMRNGGLVNTTTGVNVDGVDDFVGWLGIPFSWKLILVLPRRCQQKSAVRSEGQSTEK